MLLSSPMARLAPLLLGLALASSGGIGAPAVAAAPVGNHTVAIQGFAFTPQAITVQVGTTVTWMNQDDDPHTVIANDKTFHSSALDTNDKFSFTFTQTGEFAYFCSLHPQMTGKVIVKG